MEFKTRKIVKSGDLNGAGSLFGGRALEWIDEEAAIYAFCQLKTVHIVTKAMSAVNFMAPAKLGDIIEIGTEAVKAGNSSLTVRVLMRNKTTQEDIVKVDEVVFVNLDETGKPTPHFYVM